MSNILTKYIIFLKDNFQQVSEKAKSNDQIPAFLQRTEELEFKQNCLMAA